MMKFPSRREAFGTVQQLLDAGFREFRNAGQGQLDQLFEVIEVGFQELEVERIRDTLLRPRNAIGLVSTHHQPTDFFLVVRQAVRVAQSRQVGRHAEGFRDHVLVFNGDQWNGHADGRGQFARPLTAAEHQFFARDVGLRGANPNQLALFGDDFGDRTVFHQLSAARSRAFRESLRDVRRARLAVSRQERGANHVANVHERPQVLGLPGRQQLHVEAEGVRRRRLSLHFGPAFLVASEAQAAVHLPARCQAGLFFQPIVKFDRIAQKLGDVRIGAQLTNQAGPRARSTRR